MKKVVAILLFLALSLSLTACGSTPEITDPPESPVQTEPVSDNPLIAAELQKDYVWNGSHTEVLGERAYVYINKSELKGVTLEQYTEFCETIVEGSIYKWVSIICDDGTGIQFPGSLIALSTYGTIDNEGMIIETIGYINQTSNGFEYTEDPSASTEEEMQSNGVYNDTLILGNIKFAIPDGYNVTAVDDNTYLLNSDDGECYFCLFVADISELDEARAMLYLPMQHESFMTEDSIKLEESTIDGYIAGFDIDLNYYGEMTEDLSITMNMDATFTDSWYAYTVLFICDPSGGNQAEHIDAFAEFIGYSEYVGKDPRFDFVQ